MNDQYDFSYLVDKIKNANFDNKPFKHIYIEDFFKKNHFDEIINSQEISTPKAKNDNELIDNLISEGFTPIEFPGCVVDKKVYIDWHQNGKFVAHHPTCEGIGMALRLEKFKSSILKSINNFLASEDFNKVIANKFNVRYESCNVDGGIQKYLDGYEISPHPDVRKKAATFMVNINPSNKSESTKHHTSYLELKDTRKYIERYWLENVNVDRTWVPWDWANIIKQQTKNNSIVIFSPTNNTFHGVKANYNHLETQRTQLYGNLWYNESITDSFVDWEELDQLKEKYKNSKNYNSTGVKKIFSKVLPAAVKRTLLNIKNKLS